MKTSRALIAIASVTGKSAHSMCSVKFIQLLTHVNISNKLHLGVGLSK
jgi:hypothetical protein